ncbi:MAG: glycosyltransferase family 4 protein [Tyzzerella sp.]|nr:glycosyltransferase family 4 protein [Tyzzerella sp.]
MFFGSVSATLHRKGIVEGGTGAIAKEKKKALTIGESQKRILFLSNHFITLHSFRKELIKRLVEDGHEVYLSLPEDPDNEYFEDLGCHIIITEIDRRGVNPVKDMKLIAFYKKMIPEINPDIIFSYTIKPNIYGSLVTNGKYRQVCNITGTGATFLEDTPVARICKNLYRMSVKKAYKVFFQNTGDRDFFIDNRMIGFNYEMLPGSGCNLEEHPYTEMPDDGVIRFLFIGRVMKLKGIDEYLKAAEIVKSKYPDTEFIIAGWNEEEEYKKIVAEYQEKGFVNYIGFRDDINDWIAKCNCTVLPSHGGEGVPNVLLESAAMGRICIGSNIPGIANVIDDGVTGYLFESEDVEGLVSAMEKIVTMDVEARSAMGLAGHEKVKAEFDRQIVVNKYVDEVEKI